MTKVNDKYYTIQEVADLFRVSRQTIYKYIWSNKLRASKITKEYRIAETDLKDFIEKKQNF